MPRTHLLPKAANLLPRHIFRALVFVSALFTSSWCFAAPVHRCNGVVQLRPCGQPLRTTRKVVSRPIQKDFPRYDLSPTAHTTHAAGPYAEILTQSMSKLAEKLGQWSGTLRGNGSVQLQLLWFRNGILSSSNYMGTVKLVHKTTSFAFRTALPPGQGWSWKLAAAAFEPS